MKLLRPSRQTPRLRHWTRAAVPMLEFGSASKGMWELQAFPAHSLYVLRSWSCLWPFPAASYFCWQMKEDVPHRCHFCDRQRSLGPGLESGETTTDLFLLMKPRYPFLTCHLPLCDSPSPRAC